MTLRRMLRAVAVATVLAVTPYAMGQDTGAGNRSMAFRPGLGDAARERVPGGRLLVVAYSAVLVLLGGYVAFVAHRSSRLEDDLRRLEDDLERHRKDP